MSPVVVDLTGDDKSTSTRDQQDEKALESVTQFRAQLRRAKQDGIFLSLSEDHVNPSRRREVVTRFLTEMRRLRGGETVATHMSVAETSNKDNEAGAEDRNEDGDDDEDEESEEEEEEEELDETASELAAVEASRLKRKGFSFNPICTECKQQFDEDDNILGSCRFHSGLLEPFLEHEHWDDDDNPSVDPESIAREPDAYRWECCDRDATACPCFRGHHVEDDASRKIRLGTVSMPIPVPETAQGVDKEARNENEDEDEEKDDDEGEEGYEDKDVQDGPISRPTAKEASRLKRKGFTFNPICKNCKLQFDKDDNKESSCNYHKGILEPKLDDIFWADADDWMISDEFADENPQAYEWTCCSGNGHARPCVTTKHVEGDKSKRLRT